MIINVVQSSCDVYNGLKAIMRVTCNRTKDVTKETLSKLKFKPSAVADAWTVKSSVHSYLCRNGI